MKIVGIRELKNRLTHYVKATRDGDKVIITDRGKPVAIIQSIKEGEENASTGEMLASLAKKGLVRLPMKKGPPPKVEGVKVKGKLVSETIIEERR